MCRTVREIKLQRGCRRAFHAKHKALHARTILYALFFDIVCLALVFARQLESVFHQTVKILATTYLVI